MSNWIIRSREVLWNWGVFLAEHVFLAKNVVDFAVGLGRLLVLSTIVYVFISFIVYIGVVTLVLVFIIAMIKLGRFIWDR